MPYIYPERPAEGRLDILLDTDAFNEVDDQFAIAYMLKSPERFEVKAICAAPFLNDKVSSPVEGMEKSYQEIFNIVRLCGMDLNDRIHRGSDRFMDGQEAPVASPAAEEIVRLALAQPAGRPLYVAAIGAITNVASALLLAPEIRERIVVVWLGGHAFHWPDTREFNLYQDVAAARVVFGSGAPLVLLPCMGVVSALTTTGAELDRYLGGKNALCDYLCGIVRHDEEEVRGSAFWSRVIWDVSAIAWLLGDRFTADMPAPSPVVSCDGYYSHPGTRHAIRYVYHVNRDAIFEDIFAKLAGE